VDDVVAADVLGAVVLQREMLAADLAGPQRRRILELDGGMAPEVGAVQVHIEAHGWFGVGLEPHRHRGIVALDVPRERMLEVGLAVKDGPPGRELDQSGSSSRLPASFMSCSANRRGREP
jgi:hypothetical protein